MHLTRRTSPGAMLSLAVCLAVLALSACGDGDGTEAAAGAPTTSSATSAAKEKALAALEPYTGHPSEFPVTTPLEGRPTGKRVAYIQCPAAFCALLGPIIESAATQMGLDLYTVKGGFAGEELNRAWNAVVQQKPAGVITPSTEAVLFRNQLKKLNDMEIPVVSTGIVDALKYGISVEVAGTELNALAARLQADWLYSKLGDKTNVAFYYTPELGFTRAQLPAFEDEMASLCPDCEVRFVKVPVATLGSTAPKLIVSDLQSHPKTNATAVSQADNYNGLPSAMKVAGIKGITMISYAGTPVTYEYVKAGDIAADLSLDVPALAYTLVDAVSRGIAGQQITPDVADGLVPLQLLTKDDITFDISRGWTGYPDFVERWDKLWGPQK